MVTPKKFDHRLKSKIDLTSLPEALSRGKENLGRLFNNENVIKPKCPRFVTKLFLTCTETTYFTQLPMVMGNTKEWTATCSCY